jgi:tetratricopeptide (TPR) repeat protein
MNNTMRTTSKLLALGLLSALLFQGCAVPPVRQPVHYPPPLPEERQLPTPQPKPQPVPQVEPIRQVPKETDTIAADFSRQAENQLGQGRPDLATATLERGMRAAPKSAMLWSQLAEIKLEQQQYQQARSLAAKSNSLAGSDMTIIQKNHWIIEEALKRAAAQ